MLFRSCPGCFGEYPQRYRAVPFPGRRIFHWRANSIIHPRVRKDFTVWVERQEKCEIVGMESAILYEAGFQDTVDAVIMVYAPVELRIQRAMYRDGASEEQVRARIAAQMDDEEKRRRADFTVVNDGVQLLIPQLNRIVEQLKTEKFIL